MAKDNPADIAAKEYLEKQKKHFGKAENILLSGGLILFFVGMMLLFFLLPKKNYSKTENRTLADLPAFSIETLEEGKYKYNRYAFLEGLVAYANDHFPFRDGFMGLNGLYETASGRLGSGDVILGEDGYLLSEERSLTEKQKQSLASYVDVIDILSEKIETVVAVPGKGNEVNIDKFPAVIDTSPIAENRALVNAAFENKGYTYIDLAAALKEYNEEEIYFRTDHHWNARGALYASNAVMEAFGKNMDTPENFYRKTVLTENFKGTLYNRAGLYFLKGEELFAFRYAGDEDYDISFCSSDGTVLSTSDGLYDLSALEEEYIGTAYDVFVAPVSVPVVRIEKKGEAREKLLVLKDSFAHSMLPFLAREYDIVTVDIRRNADYALQLIEEGKVDKMLVLVNTETLFE